MFQENLYNSDNSLKHCGYSLRLSYCKYKEDLKELIEVIKVSR